MDKDITKNLTETANEVSSMQMLDEASLVRLWQHTQERNIGIITAYRGRYPVSENKKRNSQLQAEIRSAGFGFYKVEGRYIEGYGSEVSKDVKEQAFLVIGEKGNDNGKLKGILKKFGTKYDQDSILYKSFDGKGMLIGTQDKDEDGNAVEFPGMGKEISVGDFKPMKVSQFYSRMKGKPFVFEAYQEADTFNTAWLRHLMNNNMTK
jgi:beta-glucosidase/6-phospho-beta-glucosidase/beta-galactosidase